MSVVNDPYRLLTNGAAVSGVPTAGSPQEASPHEPSVINVAATRLLQAWNAMEVGSFDLDELHEAVLDLIWATESSSLDGALDVLEEFPS